MSEIRKPKYVLLLKNLGKKRTNKVELFPRELFTSKPLPYRCRMKQYRLRVNGKWFSKGYYASWQIKELFWRGVPF